MNSSTVFVLSASGQPFTIPNHLVDSTSMSVAYVIAGAPSTMTIVIEGIVNASGVAAIVDSYSGVTSTTRSITLSATYDRFRITAYWTDGKNVSVSGVLTSTGPGPTWSASSLLAIQNRPF